MFSSIRRLSDRRNAEGEAGIDSGFTLIELMVVLLILAILLAIAIPTFLGVTKSANDRAVQSNLNTAVTNAKSYFQNSSQSYGTTGAAAVVSVLTTQEPSIGWTTGASTGSNSISVFVDATAATATDGTGIILAGKSSTGNCWYVLDNSVGQTTADVPYTFWSGKTPVASNAGTFYAVTKGASVCNANLVPASGLTTNVQANSFPPSP
jgi:type IV pilus assembly protein PilA